MDAETEATDESFNQVRVAYREVYGKRLIPTNRAVEPRRIVVQVRDVLRRRSPVDLRQIQREDLSFEELRR